MSQGNTAMTVSGLIPSKNITAFELLMLENGCVGIEHHSQIVSDMELFGFYSESFNDNESLDFEDYSIDKETIDEAKDDPRNLVYFNEDGIAENTCYLDIFSNILGRGPAYDHHSKKPQDFLEIEAAITHSKMIPGEFGGFAALITPNKIMVKGTATILREMHAKIESDQGQENFIGSSNPENNNLKPYDLTFDQFYKQAKAIPLINHGRKYAVTLNDQDLGFSDANSIMGAFLEVHQRSVNNALYSISSENTGGVLPKASMPPDAVLNEYPETVESFFDCVDFSGTCMQDHWLAFVEKNSHEDGPSM